MIWKILDFPFLLYQKNEKQNWVEGKQLCFLGSLAGPFGLFLHKIVAHLTIIECQVFTTFTPEG